MTKLYDKKLLWDDLNVIKTNPTGETGKGEKEKMKKVPCGKCEYGYLTWKKHAEMRAVLILFLIAAAIFIVGYVWNDNSKNNVFTMIAILLILPMAKHLVEVIILLPFRTPAQELYEAVMQTARPDAFVFSDYVFTSQEKVMYLSSMVVQGNEIIGLTGREKEKTDQIKAYLERSMKQRALPYQVVICTEEAEYLKRIKEAVSKPQKETVLLEAVDFLRAGAV